MVSVLINRVENGVSPIIGPVGYRFRAPPLERERPGATAEYPFNTFPSVTTAGVRTPRIRSLAAYAYAGPAAWSATIL